MTFTLLKRECPVCGGAKKDCRESTTSKMVFCRESSASPSGYIFRGCDKWGFGMWQSSEEAEAFAQKSREEWQREKEQRRLERERRRQQQIASQLSAVDRHEYYSKLLDQLPLDKPDQADLERRGFNPTQIEADGYRSVEQWQQVSGQFPSNLPGLLSDGRLNSQPGCIFPVKDVNGLIVALSIRLRDGENGRYRWLTSATKKSPQGATPHLDGELPIAVFEPTEYRGDAIWLTEGLGIKPSLTRYRLAVPVVGASSGLFSGSPKACQVTLEKLSAKYKTQRIVIPVDAGDVKNPHVSERWKGEFKFLQGLGYDLQIAWWNQTDKSHPDIDELDDLTKIELISPEDFKSWVEAKQTDTSTSTKPQSNSSKEYVPFANSEIKFRIKRRSNDQESFLRNFSELHTEAGNEWLKLRSFTPDETIDSEYFYYEPPKEGEGLAAQSGLGTGKSFYTNRNYIGEDDGAISFGNRNTTLSQFVENGKEQHNRTWYLIQQDLKEGGRDDLRLIQDPQSKIISCIDSILYVRQEDATDKKLVFDEVESTLKHLNYSTTAVSYRRQHCKQRLAEIATEAHSLFLADGNLKDITVSYVEKLSGKKIKKVKNLYKGNRGKVTYYIGSERFEKNKETDKWETAERRLNDYSNLLKTMLQDPDPFIVGADSQEQLESWDRQLKEKGRRTFRLDSTTSNTVEGQKCIRNPARYIQENKIDVFLYSPSADQGLSIDLKGYFKRGYFFFFGVVLTDTQIQFLGRLRDAECHLHVYCQTKHKDANSIHRGLLSDGIQEFFVEYARDCASLSLSDIDEENRSQKLVELAHKLIEKSNDVHYQYECQLLALSYFEQHNLRNCLEYAMREAGWQVQAVTGRKISTKELDEIKATIRTERAEKILVAAPLSATEVQEIERQGIPKEEDKPKLARHKLLERIPGIETKTITEKKIIRVPAPDLTAEKTLQNLAVSEAESPSEQGLNPVHTSPDNSINSQGDCGQAVEGYNPELSILENQDIPDFDTQCIEAHPLDLIEANPLDLEAWMRWVVTKRNTADMCKRLGDEDGFREFLNQAIAVCEDALKAVKTVHGSLANKDGEFFVAQRDSMVKEVKTPAEPEADGFIEVEVEETRPVFDADFIKRIKFQDRGLISRLEGQVLLRNPQIAKLAQQKKWQKKLALFQDETQVDGVKRLNLTTYKSPWLKINTLLEMGIGYFLQPEATWTQDTPEAIAFWERGKDPKIARQIGMEVGESDVCQYIGRVLDSYGLKRESEKIKLPSGERLRQYRPKPLDPICQAIYECVEAKVLASMGEEEPVLDWEKIIEKSPHVGAESPFPQGLNPVHTCPSNSIYSQGNYGQAEGVGSELEQLVEAMPFAASVEDFASIVEDSPLEVVEEAIALQPDQPRRRQLREWLEAVEESTFATHLPQVEAEPIRVGQRVRAWVGAFRKWGQGVVSDVLEGVSWSIQLENECLDTLKIYHAHEIEPIGGAEA